MPGPAWPSIIQSFKAVEDSVVWFINTLQIYANNLFNVLYLHFKQNYLLSFIQIDYIFIDCYFMII